MENNLILFAIPIFIFLIIVEVAYGLALKRNTYRLNDSISSLSQGLISQAVAICTPFFQIGAYGLIYQWIGNATSSQVWQHWYGWLLALLFYDFLDYWLHRISHECAFFWGAHVVHHQSQFFNFSTALRQESLYPIVGCFFFFPMAVLGVPPFQFAVVSIIVLIYQFWIHTEHIGRLGWFDGIFSTPSNHRVHHATNDEYIDKNYGAILIVWDRIFGTFQREQAKCIYGTKTPLHSWNPIKALGVTYCEIFHKCSLVKGFGNKVKVLFKEPGWLPNDRRLEAVIDSSDQATVYDPPFRKYGYFLAFSFFASALCLLIFLMYSEDVMSYFQKLAILVAILLLAYCASFCMESKQKTC